MIVIPSLKPALFKTLETDFGTTIAQVIWQRMIDHLNWLDKNMPVGMVILVHKTITPGSSSWPLPSIPSNWKFCDGTVVSNADSPLNGQNVPDLRQRFLKHGASIATLGGTATMDLTHFHTGQSGFTTDADFSAPRSDDSNEEYGYNSHRHTIQASLGVFAKLPPYTDLQPYMRIV